MSTSQAVQRPAGIPERFELQRKLGQGGMATVFLARDTAIRSEVALKVLHPHLRDDELVLERFRREIAAARRIVHPNVVAIHDLVETADATFLVLQYHPGSDLKRIIRRRGRLPADEAVSIVAQVLDALGAAHDSGVVHRDVKPHNILVDEEGVARITDLGLARVDDLVGVTTHTMALGTPEYMAPEMLAEPAVDGRADLYGVGVTLFEALTGKLPFVASSPLELVRLHEEAEPPSPDSVVPDLPPPLCAVVRRAMAKVPEDRFSTAAEMRVALLCPEEMGASDGHADDGARCPKCGAPLLRGLVACVECGHQTCVIGRTERQGWRVYVPRTKAVLVSKSDADPLTFAQKHRLIEAARELGGEPAMDEARLDMRMRTPPFVVADHVPVDDVQALVEHLELPVKVLRPGVWSSLVALFRFALIASVLEKLMLAVMVGGGLIVSVFAALEVGEPWTMVALIALAIGTLGVMINSVARRTRPLMVFSGATGSVTVGEGFLARAPEILGRLPSRRIRGVVKRVLSRAIEVRGRIQGAGLPEAMLGEVDAVLDRALDLADQLATLDKDLTASSPAEIHEALEALDARIEVAEDMDTIEALIAEKARLRGQMADLDELEARRVLLTGRLLEVSSRLRALTDESDEMIHGPNPDPTSVSLILRDLESELAAHVEVDAVARGT